MERGAKARYVSCGPSGDPSHLPPPPLTLGSGLWTRLGAGLGADPLPCLSPSTSGFHLFEGPCSGACSCLGATQSLGRPSGYFGAFGTALARGNTPTFVPIPPGLAVLLTPLSHVPPAAPRNPRKSEGGACALHTFHQSSEYRALLPARPLQARGELAKGPQHGTEPEERALGDTVRLLCQDGHPPEWILREFGCSGLQNEG